MIFSKDAIDKIDKKDEKSVVRTNIKILSCLITHEILPELIVAYSKASINLAKTLKILENN